ncbi:hypothetical protein AAXB25_14905 [Paenibacillus lautus]|uniref:hypothetical protein n=1 Tax=Paenibacillus lautus TaxID=1401 RepID=UPI003D2E5C24
MAKTHFTLTGRYAGQTYCGEVRNDSDTYMHIKGESTPIMQALLNKDSDLCDVCKAVYLDSGDDE